MNDLRELNEKHKKFLKEQGFNPVDFLLAETTAEAYVFYYIKTKTLWNFRR